METPRNKTDGIRTLKKSRLDNLLIIIELTSKILHKGLPNYDNLHKSTRIKCRHIKDTILTTSVRNE